MPERNFSSPAYRYGFQGQEKDDEIKGEGNSYHAEFWQYDSRLGRRWNPDPVVKTHESPYDAFANNPIWFTDRNGADTTIVKNKRGNIILWLNYEKSKIDYKNQMNQENWDLIEVNTSIKDGVNMLKEYLKENEIELKNVVLRTHGGDSFIAYSPLFGISGETVKNYNEGKEISKSAKEFIGSLKEIADLIENGGNLCITACQAGRVSNEDIGIQLGKVLLSKNNLNLFLNKDMSTRWGNKENGFYTKFDVPFSSYRRFDKGFSLFRKNPFGQIKRYDLKYSIGPSGNNINNPWIFGKPKRDWKWIWE